MDNPDDSQLPVARKRRRLTPTEIGIARCDAALRKHGGTNMTAKIIRESAIIGLFIKQEGAAEIGLTNMLMSLEQVNDMLGCLDERGKEPGLTDKDKGKLIEARALLLKMKMEASRNLIKAGVLEKALSHSNNPRQQPFPPNVAVQINNVAQGQSDALDS